MHKILACFKKISNWALPRICATCRLVSNNPCFDLCTYCDALLPWCEPGCYNCGVSLEQQNASIYCVDCLYTVRPYTRLCALFRYQRPLPKLIGGLKFGNRLQNAELFAQLLLRAINNDWYLQQDLPQLLVPVPLHKKRYIKRGYNQALEICRPLAKALKIKCATNVCYRVKYTAAQAMLNKFDRAANVQDAFVVRGDLSKYEKIAVIDDVVTTGNTIGAVCNALTQAGAQNIEVWCVCRA